MWENDIPESPMNREGRKGAFWFLMLLVSFGFIAFSVLFIFGAK